MCPVPVCFLHHLSRKPYALPLLLPLHFFFFRLPIISHISRHLKITHILPSCTNLRAYYHFNSSCFGHLGSPMTSLASIISLLYSRYGIFVHVSLRYHYTSYTDMSVEQEHNEQEAQAAQVILKHWRARQKRLAVSPEEADGRWQDVLLQAQAQTNLQSAERGENDPKSRLRRAVFLAGRLQDGEALHSDHEGLPDENSKMLETQHWLELIDGKHRYGSNLKFYHRKWQEENTTENFFKWLDHGEGKNLSLPECSREQLEKERIIYLSREQRLNYLVRIDDQGLLRWARNNELVDTRSNRWKDAGDGRGIIPLTAEEMRGAEISEAPAKHGRIGFRSNSSDSLLNSGEAHYVDTVAKPGDNKFQQTIRSHFTSNGIMERLLRKTVKKNTWIYVCDMKRNLFIGIKETGAFQHSSFTAGGLISSAGLIKVKMGRIHKLSPLSGHYRTSVDHYRLFLEDLERQGADLEKVQVTKAELTLWGLEHYKRFQKTKQAKQKELTGALKRAVSLKSKGENPTEQGNRTRSSSDSQNYEKKKAREMEKDERWLGGAQWRRDILVGRTDRKVAQVDKEQPRV
ncbi:unnamed protein product [Rhizoctonia solani]|uniref:IQ domain-containing protein IQM6 n=1 Tax=Rhizoctonia solani TaxID=456999 RepID=A0A8H2XVJ9_9AGAM|nr:unnamed protein product [Rhizoctonia solani]